MAAFHLIIYGRFCVITEDLLGAVSEISGPDRVVGESSLEIMRGLKLSNLTQMFSDARQIEIAREISTKLKPVQNAVHPWISNLWATKGRRHCEGTCGALNVVRPHILKGLRTR